MLTSKLTASSLFIQTRNKLNSYIKFVYTTTLLFSIGFGSSVFANNTLAIDDSALKACIEKSIQKAKISQTQSLVSLKCHNKGIVNVSGIEHLLALENLSLFGNDIKVADLRALVNLKSLNLAKNKLTQLNITGLHQLEVLYIFKNKLTTLNFTGLGALQKMRIMQNKLNHLDISPLSSLKEAYLWDNQLEDLKITGLTKLTFLDVKQNPMPDELYDFYDTQEGITISHDGNADDWK